MVSRQAIASQWADASTTGAPAKLCPVLPLPLEKLATADANTAFATLAAELVVRRPVYVP
jgi:hypothetical protein